MVKWLHRPEWIIVLIYCILNAFFNNYYVQTKIPFYGGIAILFFSLLLILYFKRILKHINGNNITSMASKLLMMFILSIIWAFILWGQLPWSSMIVMGSIGGVFPLLVYFILQKYKISTQTLVKAIIIIYILYVICYLIGLCTLPTPLFGYSKESTIEDLANSLAQRGVIRLGVPGGDFVILIIFLILTRYKNKKLFYLLLIPVAITLLMRGTRTPFFATIIIAFIYYLWQIKHKWIIIFIGIIMFICSGPIYQMMLNSDSDNAVIKYVQMTSHQVKRSNEKEEDIRIEMARYMLFTEFNKNNILRILFGNGVPGYNGNYAKVIERLGDKRDYYPVDTAFTTIYVYFGIIGLILYAQLLWIVIRTKVTSEGSFAKLYIFYLYLISPANSALIFSGALTLGIALYIIQQNQIKTNVTLRKF